MSTTKVYPIVPITPDYVPQAAPAPKVSDAPDGVTCKFAGCRSALSLRTIAPERVAEFVKVHGFVHEQNEVFCSKLCAARHFNLDARTLAKMRPIVPVPAPPSDGSRLKTWASGGFAWVQCGLAVCQDRFEVPPGTDLAWRAQAAVAHGYVEAAHGVFCSKTCARESAADTAMQTKRETPAVVAAPVAASRFVEAIPEDVGVFTGYARAVMSRPADGRNVRLVLALQPLSVALVEYLGDEMVKASRRRAVAWTGETVEAACVKASAGLAAFLAGQIGSAIAPGAEIVPQ